MAKELELKLGLGERTSDSVVTSLTEFFGRLGLSVQFKSKVLINHYFDTPDFELNAGKMALRIREVEGRYIQTLKTKGQSVNGLTERGEWEWDVSADDLEVSFLSQLDVWPKEIELDSLVRVFETNFTRRQADVLYKGATIEVAFDHGYVACKGLKDSINELELELKEGSVEDLQEIGEKLRQDLGLSPSDLSKAERGFRLFHSLQKPDE